MNDKVSLNETGHLALVSEPLLPPTRFIRLITWLWDVSCGKINCELNATYS